MNSPREAGSNLLQESEFTEGQKALYPPPIPQDRLGQLGHTEPVTLHAILLLEEKLKKSIVSGGFYQLVILHSANVCSG